MSSDIDWPPSLAKPSGRPRSGTVNRQSLKNVSIRLSVNASRDMSVPIGPAFGGERFISEGVHRVHFHWPAITVNIPVNGLGVVKRIM